MTYLLSRSGCTRSRRTLFCRVIGSGLNIERLPTFRSIMSIASSTHEERTAAAQREADLHQVKLAGVDQVNDSVRVLRLQIPEARRVKASRLIGSLTHDTIS